MNTNITYIPFVFPEIENVFCAFTTRNVERQISTSPLGINISYILSEFNLSTYHELIQVHGTKMIFNPSFSALDSKALEGDALATNKPDQALVVKVADCQPVLLAHKSGHYIAALHVGWRANRNHTPTFWVKQFCEEFDLNPADTMAIRGPSLGPDKSEFVNFEQEWGPEFLPYFNQKNSSVNLWKLTRDQLQKAGIPDNRIFSLDLCTYKLPNMFFSYRRNKNCGRQTGIIWYSK